MPAWRDHVRKAERNESFCRLLLEFKPGKAARYEWAITGFFYSALHYLDAFYDYRASLHPHNHSQRRSELRKYSEISDMGLVYLNMEQRSMDARYGVARMTQRQVSQLDRNSYLPFKKHMRALLGIDWGRK